MYGVKTRSNTDPLHFAKMAKKVHSYVAKASEDIKPVLNRNFFSLKKEIHVHVSKELVDHSYQESKEWFGHLLLVLSPVG